jgi:ubiquinone/menaquinone biosynthesis C-methylase UbiE
MRLKSSFSSLLRKLNLLDLIDKIRFNLSYLKNFFAIKTTQKKYKTFKFPPAYFIYETYHLNYEHYYTDGKQTATEINDVFCNYIDLKYKSINVLDWGCGPARVIRHLPTINEKIVAFGSDYNSTYINWNSKNIEDVTFKKNEILPPLQFSNNFFDAIYSLSIITHLSEKAHYDWIEELFQKLKPNGILIITSQGNVFAKKLIPSELQQYQNNELVVRTTTIEGQRNYSAFQPKDFMEKLLHKFEILEFIEGNSANSIHGEQDTWIVRKN